MKTTAMNAPTPAMLIANARVASSSEEYAFAIDRIRCCVEAAGPTGAMRAKAETMVARAGDSYVDPFNIGETFAQAGMVDEALYWLEEAVEHGSYEMAYVNYWPHLDVLRDDPRYKDLHERVYGQRIPITLSQ